MFNDLCENKVIDEDVFKELESSHRDAILTLLKKDFSAPYYLFNYHPTSIPSISIVTRPGFAPSDIRTLPPFSAKKREVSTFAQSGVQTEYLLEMIVEEAVTRKRALALEIYQLLEGDSIMNSLREQIFKKHYNLFEAGFP
jgi:hypothetical protein